MARILSMFRFLFQRERVERELDSELQYHVDRQTELNIGRGMTPEEARREARLSVGGVEPLKEECRDARLGRMVEVLFQDIRYGARVLRKNPGFSAVAILTLALGIGANTAIFSVIYGVFLRPLPYAQGGQLVVLHQPSKKLQTNDVGFSVKEMKDYSRSPSLQSVVEHHTMSFLLLSGNKVDRVQTAVVSANFFDVLGVRPLLGRTFIEHDDAPDSDAVLVLAYEYWQSRQGGDPNIVGKVFKMNDRPHTVIGVLPRIPQYPVVADVYMPTSHCPTRSNPATIANREARMLTVFGRLKPDTSVDRAQADLKVVGSQMTSANPDVYKRDDGYGIVAAPLQDELTRRARATLFVLLGGAGFVLLIACANVANLLLARLLKLEKELSVRAALGASKMRLMRQLLTESLMLSLMGGAVGLALAPAALAVLVQFTASYTERAAEVRIDGPVLLFAVLVAVGTGILFGLTPLFAPGQWAGKVASSGSRATAGRRHHRLRRALVIAQVAVSFILLIGAGLMMRSFLKLQQVDPGFKPDHLLTMRVSPGFHNFENPKDPNQRLDERMRFSDRMLDAVRSAHGVESAAFTQVTPFTPGSTAGAVTFEIKGSPDSKDGFQPKVDVTTVGANYFETIRQPLVKGRTFTDRDDRRMPGVAVINQTMARHRFPNSDPIGREIRLPSPGTAPRDVWFTIVGVVADAHEYGVDHQVLDELYLPMAQTFPQGVLVVRTAADPTTVQPALRAALNAVEPLLAIDRVTTVERAQYESLTAPRVMTILLGVFAALALLISASGISAVMVLSVRQRTRELGIRMALGAARGTIVNMVVRQGLVQAVVGAIIGMAGAAALTRYLSTMLFDTSRVDVVTYAAVFALFLAIAAIACFIPARQVTAIDPLRALRQE